MRRYVVALVTVAVATATGRICLAAPANTAVVLEAKDESSLNVASARATIDGAQVVERLDGSAIPVSPGPHRAVFVAAGFRTVESTFVVAEGQRLRVVVFLSVAAPGTLIVAAPTPRERDEPARIEGRQRILALALGGAGVAALAVGAIWSLKSKSTYDDALSSQCGGDPNLCSPQGIADGQTAHRQAAVATVGFVAAGVLLAAGAVLYVTGPKQSGVAVAPSVDGGPGLVVAGAW